MKKTTHDGGSWRRTNRRCPTELPERKFLYSLKTFIFDMWASELQQKTYKKHFCLAEADGIGRSFEKATLLSFAHLEPTFYGECCLKNRLNLIHVCHTNPRYSPLIIHFFTGYNPVNITLTYQRGTKKKKKTRESSTFFNQIARLIRSKFSYNQSLTY